MGKNLEVLSKIGVLPSVKLTFPADILALADALSAAGVPCAEFVYNFETAQVLNLLAEKRPDFIAGAYVHTQKEAEAAQKAGAKFITDDGVARFTEIYCNPIPSVADIDLDLCLIIVCLVIHSNAVHRRKHISRFWDGRCLSNGITIPI